MEPWIPLLGAACCCLPIAGVVVCVAVWFLVRGDFGGGTRARAAVDPSLDGPTVRVTPPPPDLAPTTEVPRVEPVWPSSRPSLDREPPRMPAAPRPPHRPAPAPVSPAPISPAPVSPAPVSPAAAPPPATPEPALPTTWGEAPSDFDDEDDLATVVAPPPPGLLNPSRRPGAHGPQSPASAPPAPLRSSSIHPRRPGQTIIAFDDDEDDEDNEIG